MGFARSASQIAGRRDGFSRSVNVRSEGVHVC